MRFRLGIFPLAALAAVIHLSPPTTATEIPRIILTVPDTAIEVGTTSAPLNIYIDNLFDTLAGFQFVLQSTRPDLVTFDFSLGGFDTTGTLTSGFELALAHDSLPDHSTVKFQCIADLPFNPNIQPGISPQQGGVAVRIPILVTDKPDTTLSLVSLIKIIEPFDFSDPHGVSIGTVIDTTYDTTYFYCTAVQNDSCVSWDSSTVGVEPYDSLRFDTLLFGYLDTTQVVKQEGSVTILPQSLNCDFDLNGKWEITDLTCFIDYLFGGGADPELCPNQHCDFYDSGQTDITDLTYLVNFLFAGGPPPN